MQLEHTPCLQVPSTQLISLLKNLFQLVYLLDQYQLVAEGR